MYNNLKTTNEVSYDNNFEMKTNKRFVLCPHSVSNYCF